MAQTGSGTNNPIEDFPRDHAQIPTYDSRADWLKLGVRAPILMPSNRSLPPHSSKLSVLLVLAAAFLIAGCAAGARAPLPTALLFSSTRQPTIAPTGIRSAAQTLTPSPTPDPYVGLTIDELQVRSYGEGTLEIESRMGTSSRFTRLLFSYPSDGLQVYGFMNVPNTSGPRPVVLVLHGFVTPATYRTIAYTRVYADALANAGYFVLHPNYRNHPPSEDGPNPYRIGYAIDVLNLIALVRQQAGEGALEKADGENIGLLGHSMGGGITLRVLTVDPEIGAAVLYGSMSADERRNFEQILIWTDGDVGDFELNPAEDELRGISPLFYLEQIQAAASIHHGAEDNTVPPEWSEELCALLDAMGKSVECFSYPDQPHTFYGEGYSLFMQRVLRFFNLQLGAP